MFLNQEYRQVRMMIDNGSSVFAQDKGFSMQAGLDIQIRRLVLPDSSDGTTFDSTSAHPHLRLISASTIADTTRYSMTGTTLAHDRKARPFLRTGGAS